MARKKAVKPEVAPPEVETKGPEQVPEEPQVPPEAIETNDAPAGAGEAVDVVEETETAIEAGVLPDPIETVAETKERVLAALREADQRKEIFYGLHEGYVTVDRPEFAKLIKQLTYGQPFDPYGIMAMLQKMLHLGSWEEAKKATETLMKG